MALPRLERHWPDSAALRAALRAETDTNYYAVMCFETEEQRDEFSALLAARGLKPKHGNRFVDGLATAAAMGLEIKSPRVAWPKSRAPAGSGAQVPDEREPPARPE